ncbi:minor capsid protein [Enterococcus sp. LJL99]
MVRVKVDLSGVNKKLSAGNMQSAKYGMMNQMLMDMQPFVPNDQGTLQSTGTISADKSSLVWSTPYAKAQYYGTNGKVVFRKYTTPGTGPYWDLRAKGLYMNDWQKVFLRGLNL